MTTKFSMSALQGIVDYQVAEVSDDLATYFPLDSPSPFPEGGSVAITRVLSIGPFTLEVVNPSRLCDKNGQDVPYNELIGKTVESVDEDKDMIKITLSGNLLLTIDLRDESYIGPEALALYGPDNLCVVWN